MKHLQTFSKYFIYITLIWIPAIWCMDLHYDFYYTSMIFGRSFAAILWDIAWVSILLVMMIRPLSELFPQFPVLKKLIFLRKAFGILSATIVITNLVVNGLTRVDFLSNYFSFANWSIDLIKIDFIWHYFYFPWFTPSPFFARMSEVTAIILLATSNMWSMKKLWKNWKRIQKLTYLYFISGWLVAGQYEPVWYYGSMGIVGVVYIGALIKK